MHVELLLMDEQAGRQEAARRGLKVAGTLSVLDEAEQAGLVNFDAAVARLRQTSFTVSSGGPGRDQRKTISLIEQAVQNRSLRASWAERGPPI